MINDVKRLGIWAGIIIGGAALSFAGGVLITLGFRSLSMSMDSLDQPLENYYNLNNPLGKQFYQLSLSQSSNEHKFLIVPGAIGEEGIKNMLSPDGWEIADDRWIKRSRIQKTTEILYGNKKVTNGMTISGSIDNGTFCDVNVPSLTQASDYRRLFDGVLGKRYLILFSHEVGHCFHNLLDEHSDLVPTESVLENALASLVDLDFKDEAVQWTNNWEDDSFSEMYHRYLKESFADVYAYSHLTYEKGYSAQRIHDLMTEKQARNFAELGRAVYFTAPFVAVAHANRDKMNSFSSPAMFANYIIWEAMYSTPKFFSATLVAHLVMSGKVEMSEVKNKARIRTAIKAVEYYY